MLVGRGDPAPVTTTSTTYVCVIGFDYEPKTGKPQRFEPDASKPNASIAGLPKRVIADLTEQGVIKPIDDQKAGA